MFAIGNTICTKLWRADVGKFYLPINPLKILTVSICSFLKLQNMFSFFFNIFCSLPLRQHCDIAVNDGESYSEVLFQLPLEWK